MTLAAPKSRQGKFALVLAFLAAVIAVLAVFLWSTSARADFTATAVITDDVDTPITQFSAIQYTVVVDVTVAGSGTTTNTILSADFDDTLTFVGFGTTALWATECNNGAGNVLTCTDALGPLVDDTLTVDFTADLPGTIVAPTCTIVDDGTGSISCTTAITDVVVAPGEIRHLDEADRATEDAAGLDSYCTDQSIAFPDCGILAAQDDSDDAVGSFHQACLIYGVTLAGVLLTHTTDSADITWDISAGPGSNATVVPANGEKVAGPLDEPCVRWGSAGTGSQTITATYDPDGTVFYWSDSTSEPLVKQWNDIDPTRIVTAGGEVGDTLLLNTDGNTGDIDDWASRDCTTSGFCGDPNVDGLTFGVESFLVLDPDGFVIIADPMSFIEYVNGSHDDQGGSYSGPIDGVSQTYTLSGDCGSVRLEDPLTGTLINLQQGDAAVTLLSSDKGVGFTFVPNDDGAIATTLSNADCSSGSEICIGITSTEDNLFDSGPLQTAPAESVCVTYDELPELVAKTPMLAWAGQRVVLSHDWGFDDGTGTLVCPWDTGSTPGNFHVLYSVQAGPGSFTAALQGNLFDVSQTGQDAIVEVDPTDCTSHVIFENQDQAQNDIIAYVVTAVDGTVPNLANANPVSQQVPFVIYYMKFEDATLTLVPGVRDDHNSGPFDPAGPFDSSSDVDSMSDVNVSADVLARLRVRGWVTTTNCPVRDSGTGANGEFLPANRCIFPDDWRFKAGGGVGDSLNDPTEVSPDFAFDSRPNFDTDGDGFINAWDAPMPSALASFGLVGAGFLRPADKLDVYPNSSPTINQNYSTPIPPSPFIAPINADLSGYQWDSVASGDYNFWTDLADHGPEVISCATDCSDAGDPGVLTGGYLLTKVYTDNHGEAMTWVNGDANLDFSDCTDSASAAGHMIVLLDGYYCDEGTAMGDSVVSASIDYPDKRKHFAIEADDVTIDWTWGGIKEVTFTDNGQFNYVVFHVTDRDGDCGNGYSLHPVLGERVTFLIDSPGAGTITANENGDAVALAGTWTTTTADVTTFETDPNDTTDDGGLTRPTLAVGECQAWIHITESLQNPINVIVTAFDPEGTVTFDKILNAPTPVPTDPPADTPTPTPANQQNLWADIDCNGGVNPTDSLKMLRADAGMSVSQDANCPDPSEDLDVIWDSQTTNDKWGDADCNGELTPVDSLKVLRFDAGLFYIQQEPCPDIGQEVLIPQQ